MKLYTRRGDDGATERPGGQRVPKCAPAVRAGGAVDELAARLGWCAVAAGDVPDVRGPLAAVQEDLFAVGALLAAAGTSARASVQLGDEAVRRMEETIDGIQAELPPLAQFVVPGGSELAARLHLARTACRRAECEVSAWAESGTKVPPAVPRYLNRLADLLFALGRLANRRAGAPERTWEPPA